MSRRYRIRTTREGEEVFFAEKQRIDGAKTVVWAQLVAERLFWTNEGGRAYDPVAQAVEAARRRLRNWRKDTGETLALNIGGSVIRLEEV